MPVLRPVALRLEAGSEWGQAGSFKGRFLCKASEWGKAGTFSSDSPPNPPVHGGESDISPLRAGGPGGAFVASVSDSEKPTLERQAGCPSYDLSHSGKKQVANGNRQDACPTISE